MGDTGISPRVAQYLRYNGTALESIAFDTVPNAYFATQTVTPTNAAVVSAVRDGVGQTVQNWINGTASSSTATANTPASGTTVLADVFWDGAGTTNSGFSGAMAEHIVLGAASTSDRSLIETSQRAYAGI